jgi:hypothetical protein
MRSLKPALLMAVSAAALAPVLAAALPAVPAGAAAATVSVTAAPAAAAAPGSGGCHVERTPAGWVVVCSNGSGTPGSLGGGGGGGGGSSDPCTLSSLPPGYPFPYPAPKGEKWMWMSCQTPGQAGLVLVPTSSTTADPGVTPEQLMQIALASLKVPVPAPKTAPPRGDRGLVGLPEWVWLPRGSWHPVTAQVSVGPVWARVTARPAGISISPGGGQPGVSCPGPGTAYDPRLPASAQHTDCSVTYLRSSLRQPRNQYQTSVTVTWTASWTGSGGAGGAINPPLTQTTTFGIRVAEGQALVTGGGQ